MKIISKLFVVTLLAVIIASCNMMRSVNTSVLKIGMTKEEAEITLKKKPYGIIAAKNFPEFKTIVEVVSYIDAGTGESYWLYFVNNKLDKWEPADKYHPPYIESLDHYQNTVR